MSRGIEGDRIVGSISRSIKRKKEKKTRKDLQKRMDRQLDVVNNMPESCESCTSTFDKTDKHMLDEWHIVIYPGTPSPTLYCPDCWDSAPENVGNVSR